MRETKYYHGLPAVSWTPWAGAGALITTAYVPVHVYECEKCRYIELHGTAKQAKVKGLKPRKRK
jgi:hypothetical protein